MRYTVYESDNVEPDPLHGLKRTVEGSPILEKGPDNGPGDGNSVDASIEPYSPPIQQLRHHRHLSQHRQHMSHHAHRGSLPENASNSSMAQDPNPIIYKRTDPDTPMPDADAEFSLYNIFKCPRGDDSKDAQLPEFRCK